MEKEKAVLNDKKYPIFYPETAEKYIKIFENLVITDLLNMPKIKDLSPDLWYKKFAYSFFGSIDIEKRERLIQEFFVLIPKKNAKSTASGLIMLANLIANPYKGAEFALIASSKEVIDNCFIPISESIANSSYLKSFLKCTNGKEYKQVEDLRTGAKLKIVTPLLKTNQGKKWQGVLIDELALWQYLKDGVTILNEITGNLVNKKDAFIIYLTTQSHTAPCGIFKAYLEKARRINNSGIDEILKNKFLPILYEFSSEEIKKNYHKMPEKWAIVNPCLGISVDIQRLKQMQSDAIQAGKQAENEFYSKYLNVEIENEFNFKSWQGAEFIKQCEKTISLDTVIEKSNLLYIGIDGGGLDDLTGLAVIGIDDKNQWWAWCKGYCYKSTMNRAGLAVKLKDFEKQGEVFIAEKIGDDAKELSNDIAYILGSGKVSKIGIDPRGIGEILINLKKIIDNENMIDLINQGVQLQNAGVILTRKLAEKSITIAKNDLFRFCANNAVIEERENGEFLSKKSSQFKIDLLMALLNCVALWERYGNKKALSVIDGRLSNAIRLINALKG